MRNLTKIGVSALLVIFSIFSVSLFAQTDSKKSGGKDGNQMYFDLGNFKTFSAKKVINEELWAKHNSGSFKTHPEFGVTAFNGPANPNAIEVLEKRKSDERYFINPADPSEFYIQKSLGAMHFMRDGNWITIDHRIKDKGNGIYEAPDQFDPVGFDVKKKMSYIKMPTGIVYFNNWKLIGVKGEEHSELASPDWSNYTAGDDGIYVYDMFPGIDAQMRVHRGSIKTNFVIKSLLFSGYDKLVFADEFVAGNSKFTMPNGSTRGVSVLHLEKDGQEIIEVGEAIAYPQGYPKSNAFSPEYSLDGSSMHIIVPVDYINKYISSTHVIIDPVVTSTNTLAQASIGGSMYNASCNFTNSCNYNLSVNSPANAMVTDIQWSFVYIAQGACWLEDGAIRIAYGACLSPATAGFYWFCNQANPGTCTGTNISIYNDLGSCVPAPSCNPFAMNFTMQFFRSCWGTTGCSNTCIGANSGWTMTITGRTVEFTAAAPNEYTASATTVCAGQNINVNTGVGFGVPTYTVNWSTNASGTPSVGTGTSTSINWPTAGTYTLYCIVTDACGQTATAQKTITVNPIPTANAGSPQVLTCTATTVQLNGSGGGTYAWSGPGIVSGGTTATPTVNAAGTYSLVVTASGCSSTTATVAVTSNTTPPGAGATANGSLTCSSTSTTLTGTPSTGVSYSWAGTGIVSGGTTASPTVNAAGVYTLTTTSLTNGCTSTATVSVTSNTTPPGAGGSANGTITCTTTTVTITGTPATGVSYNWAGTGIVSGGTTSTPTVNAGGSYTLTTTDLTNGCTSTATITVNSNTTPPGANAVANGQIDCNNTTTTITGTPASGVTYSWSGPGVVSGGTSSTVTVNAGGTYTLTTTSTTNGCTSTSTVNITDDQTPPAGVTATANGQITCTQTSVTLTGTPASGVTYNWSGPSILSGGNTANPTVGAAGVYTLTATSTSNGCTATATVSVTSNGTFPTATITSSPNQTVISCTTTSITVNGTPSSGANGAWTGPSGPIAGSSFTVTVSSVGTYTYAVVDPNNGCATSSTVTFTADTATPQGSIANPANITCSNPIVTLSGSSNPTTVNYSWSGPGIVSGGTSSSPTVNTAGTYTMTVTNPANGCSSSSTVVVTSTNNPPSAPTAAGATYCAGQTVNPLSATGGTGTINWYSDPGLTNLVGTGATFAPSPSPTITTTYYVVETENGCQSSATPVTITINPIPSAPTSAGAAYCSGATINPLTAGGGGTMTWYSDAGLTTQIGTGSPFTLNPSPTSTTTYYVTQTANGCTGPATAVTVTINPVPSMVGTAVIDTAKCGVANGSVTGLTASGGTPGYTYNWVNTGSGLSVGNSANLNNVAGGTYSLTVTDANGCSVGSGTAFTVPSTSAVIASAGGSPLSGSGPLTVSFTNGSTGANTYIWNFGDGSGTSTAQTPSHTFNNNGTYLVTLLASNGSCFDTSIVIVRVEVASEITFPNVFSPNGDDINDHFMFFTVGIKELTADIYNRWGEVVGKINGPTGFWDGKTKGGNYASEGTYFFMVKATGYDGKTYEKQGSVTLVK